MCPTTREIREMAEQDKTENRIGQIEQAIRELISQITHLCCVVDNMTRMTTLLAEAFLAAQAEDADEEEEDTGPRYLSDE